MRSANETLSKFGQNEQILLHVLEYLEFEYTIRLGLVSRKILDTLKRTPGLFYVHLTFAARQKIRRQIFEQHPPRALPSLFTHIFDLTREEDDLNVLATLLSKPNRLKRFSHERSGKDLKLYHPYFYRQLPLRLHEKSFLPPPIVQPQNVPLPHDMSLSDFLFLISIHHASLRSISYNAYGSCPLAWNTTPSRVCPRDLIGRCLSEDKEEGRLGPGMKFSRSSVPEVPYQIRIWCPDCRYSGADHDRCWLFAGMLLKQRILNTLGTEEERKQFCKGWASKNGLVFESLEELHISGWALANCLSLMRMMGFSKFPKLKKLKLDGLMIVAPSLTEAKDAVPRPKLTKPSQVMVEGAAALTPAQEGEKLIRLAQCCSFNYAPFSRRYQSREAGHYHLGFFNGDVWNHETFPKLEEVSVRGQNFDDAARWVTPWFENCLSLLPQLKIVELDHVIIRPFDSENNPIIRLFTLANEGVPERLGSMHRFPSLEVVKLKMIDSPLTLLQVESTLSDIIGRPIRVQARKILVCVFDHDFLDQVNLIKSWAEYQKYRLTRGTTNQALDCEASCFAEETADSPDNGLIILNFDKAMAVPRGGGVQAGRDVATTVREDYPSLIDFGPTASKIVIKHYTPSDPAASSVLSKLRFGRDIEDEMLVIASTMPDEEDIVITDDGHSTPHHNKVLQLPPTPIRSLRRIDVQLDFPQVWQISEQEAMKAVEMEIGLLKCQLNEHPDLRKVSYVRVSSCTRLTYGGSNWDWWESIISGNTFSRDGPPQRMGCRGWARESISVINEELLARYQCEHMSRSRDEDHTTELDDEHGLYHPAVGPERMSSAVNFD